MEMLAVRTTGGRKSAIEVMRIKTVKRIDGPHDAGGDSDTEEAAEGEGEGTGAKDGEETADGQERGGGEAAAAQGQEHAQEGEVQADAGAQHATAGTTRHEDVAQAEAEAAERPTIASKGTPGPGAGPTGEDAEAGKDLEGTGHAANHAANEQQPDGDGASEQVEKPHEAAALLVGSEYAATDTDGNAAAAEGGDVAAAGDSA
eukprot:XP_001689970.1 predicted protein [Chlamydomonas reinhardtii]